MCDGEKCCQKPEELVDKPEECLLEQIEKCHGTRHEHPCAEQSEKE
jgi:hypothetical protein